MIKMEKQSVPKQVQARIKMRRRGAIFFPSDFVAIGGTEVVKKALLRLEREGFLTRLASGIYLYPKKSKLLGNLTPSIEVIATAIAKRDKARIVATGAYALNALGLSTQVALSAVYLTDGAPRKIKVGNRIILFKKASPRNLAARGAISKLVIQALKALGEGNLDLQQEQKIIAILQKEKQENLLYDIALAPAWIRIILKKALRDTI